MTSPASGRRLRAIQRMCHIVLSVVCVQAMHRIQRQKNNYNAQCDTTCVDSDERHGYM